MSNLKLIYLDYAATTPVDPRVAEKMSRCLTKSGVFGNPASVHYFGTTARGLVEEAREQVADLINAEASEIIWTSGATESDNLAIKGAARMYQRKGKHIITMQTEHKAVLDTCQQLEKEGYQVTYLKPQPTGLLDLAELEEAIRDDTILVSVMHVNNEIGTIQDIQSIAEMTSQRGILFHVDAAQGAGKLDIDVEKTPIDMMSLCAHKKYGPKGVGALYLRKKPRVRVEPLIHGGGHEQGMRSGTLPTHQLVGMGESCAIAYDEMEKDRLHAKAMRELFLKGLADIPSISINGSPEHSVPNILNLRFDGMLSEAIMMNLPQLAVSTASACQGKGTEGSFVLRALGLNDEQTKSSVRFSFGRFTTEEEVTEAAKLLTGLFVSF